MSVELWLKYCLHQIQHLSREREGECAVYDMFLQRRIPSYTVVPHFGAKIQEKCSGVINLLFDGSKNSKQFPCFQHVVKLKTSLHIISKIIERGRCVAIRDF